MKQRPAGTPSIRSDASRHRASVISVIRATRIGRYRDCGPWASRRCPRTVFLQLAPEAMCPGLFRAKKLRAFLYGRGLRRSCPVFSLSSACHNQLAGEQTGANSMFVTEDEAAAMYARASRSWYGPKARSVAKSKVCSLRAKGDDKGVVAWQKVVDALE